MQVVSIAFKGAEDPSRPETLQNAKHDSIFGSTKASSHVTYCAAAVREVAGRGHKPGMLTRVRHDGSMVSDVSVVLDACQILRHEVDRA